MNSTELMQKVAEVEPDKYHFIVNAARELVDSPFRDEVVEKMDRLMEKAASLSSRWVQFANESPKAAEELQKEANDMGKWTQFAQRNPFAAKALGAVGGGAAGVAGAALAGIAYSLAGDMYDSVKRGLTKSRDYKNMMQDNPDLKQLDPRQVQRAFSVLHKFNPEFASDPIVAGSFVRRAATFEGDVGFTAPRELKELIDARKSLGDIRKLPNVPQTPDNRLRALQRKKTELDINEQIDPDSPYNMKRNNDIYAQEQQQHRNAMEQFQAIMGRVPGDFRRGQRGRDKDERGGRR